MDPQAIATIATTAVAILSPYLAKAAEAVAPKIGQDIYQAIKTRLSGKPTAQEALADLEKTPTDTDTQAALRVQLKKLLAEDEAFTEQLKQLLQKAGQTEAGATIIKQVARDHNIQIGQIFGGNLKIGPK